MESNEKILQEKQKSFTDSLIKYTNMNGGMISDSLKSELIDELIKALSIINMTGTYIEEDC